MAVLRFIILAVQFLTIVPTPKLRDVQVAELRKSVAAFPIVGSMLGFCLYGATQLFTRVLPHSLAAVAALTVYTSLTGALHADALMDTADAIGSRRGRAEALAIMKDSRVGAMGVMACVLLVAMKWASIQSLHIQTLMPFIVVPAVSRFSMVLAMTMSPSARPGSGLGSIYAKQISFPIILAGFMITAIIVFVGPSVWARTWVLVSGMVITVGFTWWMKQKFGGMTGDTYGALNEILEVILWTLCSGLELHGLL